MPTESPLNCGAELLRAAGSITQVAEELGVTPRVVSGWRAGKIPSDENIAKLKRAYNIADRAWRMPVTAEESAFEEPVWLALVMPMIEFHHPRAYLGIYRCLLRDHPRELAQHEAMFAADRAKHPELYAACERAELALGRALATDHAEGCDNAKAFLEATKALGSSDLAAA